MRLALIGDIHFYRLAVSPLSLLGKRALGQGNLWLRRRRSFRSALLEPVLQRAVFLECDAALFSGDLTTTALSEEFGDVAEVLLKYLVPMQAPDQARLGQRLPGLIVPGNHDRYTFSSARQRLLEKTFADLVPSTFPSCTALSPSWTLVGLDAAVPRVLTSRGRLGREQLRAFESIVSSLNDQQGLIVLCHYPLLRPPGAHDNWGHRIADQADLRRIIATSRARVIYLHGHVHRPWVCMGMDFGLPQVIEINAGAPCQVSKTFPLGQGFCEIELPSDPGQPVRVRRHLPRLLRVSRSDDAMESSVMSWDVRQEL